MTDVSSSLGPILAAVGGFFAVEFHADAQDPVDPWQSAGLLLTGQAGLDDRVAATRTALAAGGGLAPEVIELRVAASVAQLGLAARLLAPVLAAAVITGRLIEVDLSATWWQPVLGGPFPLSLAAGNVGAPADRRSAGEIAAFIDRQVLQGPVAALVAATERFSVSGRVRWGNVASGVHSALNLIGSTHPDRAEVARQVGAELRRRPTLAGSGEIVDGRFRRNSCCLIYRVSGFGAAAICGDCVLGARPTRM